MAWVAGRIAANVSICVRAGLSKPRPVPDTERNKDTKTLDCGSTPLDANTLLWPVGFRPLIFSESQKLSALNLKSEFMSLVKKYNSFF